MAKVLRYAYWSSLDEYRTGAEPTGITKNHEAAVEEAREAIGVRNMPIAICHNSRVKRPIWTLLGLASKASYRSIGDKAGARHLKVREGNYAEAIAWSKANLAANPAPEDEDRLPTEQETATQEAEAAANAEAEATVEAPNVADEGQLVLTLSPKIADLLRDAFILVAQGRSVTIKTEAPR